MTPPRTLLAAGLATLLGACASAPEPSTAAAPPPRPALSLTYLGTAGWQLDLGAHTLLVDPYFTRVEVSDEAAPLSPDQAEIDKHAPRHAEVVLVGHSHYDHVLDVPDIARRTGATVVGTESSMHLLDAAGIPAAQRRQVAGGETLSFGEFEVRPLRALHSLTGQAFATIPAGIHLPLPAKDYGEGGTLHYLVRAGGRTVLFVGTANFVEAEMKGLTPDVAVVAVGLREKIPDYTCRLLRAVGGPRLVLTNHFDAFREKLGPKQMDIGEDGRKGLDRFADEVHSCFPATRVVVPVHEKVIPL